MSDRVVIRWATAAGAWVAAVLAVVVAAAGASADGRRGSVIFGVMGVALLVAGLVISSAAYPAGFGALLVAAAFALAGNSLPSATVVALTACLLLVDQLAAWSFDAATGTVERGSARTARGARTALIVVVGGALAALVLAAGDLPVPGGLVAEVIGITAALGVVALATSRRWDR